MGAFLWRQRGATESQGNNLEIITCQLNEERGYGNLDKRKAS